MSATNDNQTLDEVKAEGSGEDFAAYCRIEFERRQNSGEAFDEERFQEVVDMVLRRLQATEEEAWS